MKRSHRFHAAVAMLATLAVAGPVGAKTAPTTVFHTISTKAPSWYTEELHARVMAAGDRGVPLPTNVEIPVSTLAFLGIRPGQLIMVHNGPGAFSLCTANFVFRNGPNYAIGTAGHCGNVGNTVSMIFAPRGLVNIGTITKSTGDVGIGNDFALISIKPSLNSVVSPSVAFWGGPKSAYSGTNVPNLVKHIGWGVVVGTGGTPRIGIGTYYSTTRYYFLGVITPGDSGGPATSGDNRALGNITHISAGIDEFGLHLAAGTSMARILQIAGLPLATCSSARPWPLYGCPKI